MFSFAEQISIQLMHLKKNINCDFIVQYYVFVVFLNYKYILHYDGPYMALLFGYVPYKFITIYYYVLF